MAGGDKRAKLMSGLVAARGASPSAEPAQATPPVARSSVIKIADRRPSDDRVAEPAPSVLYSKGAATASTFKPSYWSYDHGESPESPAAPAPVAKEAPAVAVVPAAAPAPPRASRPLPINFVIAFGCVALVMSTALFVMSQRNRAEDAAAQAVIVQLDQPAETAAAAPAKDASAPEIAAPATAPPITIASASPREIWSEPVPSAAPARAVPTPAAVPIEKPQPKPVAAAPIEAPAAVSAEPAPAFAAVPPAPAAPAPTSPQAPAAQSETPVSPEIETLLARGDELLANGDVVAARLFYQRAAEQGSAAAATAVGQTYDPFFLDQVRVRGARGDVRAAEDWYRKAIAAGDRQAEVRLKRLIAKPPA
jgi:outer membrane biosynthesis protein TonB